MRKILLISDTHGFIDKRLEKHIDICDEIWHAGDIGNLSTYDQLSSYGKELRIVFGNIDGQDIRTTCSKDLIFSVENKKVWITHIGGYPPKYRGSISQFIKDNHIEIFICGHSHILKVIFDKALNCLHLNPGAIGKHGFHKIQTALSFQLEKGQIKEMRIIELTK